MSATLSIQLLKPHRHAGRNYLPGQTIELATHTGSDRRAA